MGSKTTKVTIEIEAEIKNNTAGVNLLVQNKVLKLLHGLNTVNGTVTGGTTSHHLKDVGSHPSEEFEMELSNTGLTKS